MYQCTECKEYTANKTFEVCDECVEKQHRLEADAEIGHYVRMAFEKGYELGIYSHYDGYLAMSRNDDVKDLIKWGREQEGNAEKCKSCNGEGTTQQAALHNGWPIFATVECKECGGSGKEGKME